MISASQYKYLDVENFVVGNEKDKTRQLPNSNCRVSWKEIKNRLKGVKNDKKALESWET